MLNNIIVTGGTGLVGSAIKEYCMQISHNYHFIFISSKDCDLTKKEQVVQLFKKYQPYGVIHLAANVGGLYKNMNNKIKMFEDNLLINFNVIQCCYEFNVQKVISCLSTCVFPNIVKYPIFSSDLNNGPPHSSNEGYSYAKRILELHSKLYREEYGLDYRCVIPVNVYGKNDNFSLEDGHVIPSLIHKAYLAKKNNEPFVIRGSGKPLRQFIYSEDLAKVIINMFLDIIKETNIIVGNPVEYSIGSVAMYIANLYDITNIIFDTSYDDGQFKKTADVYTKNIKYTPIQQGLRETVMWFNNNYENLRM